MGRFLNRPTNNYFNKLLTYSILSGVLYFMIGVFFFFYPLESIRIIGVITGFLFIISSIITGYKYFKGTGAQLYRYDLIFSILKLIVGIILIVAPYELSDFLTKVFGIFVIISGANKTSYGLWFKIGNEPSWLLTITVGIMFIVFGIILVLFPFTNVFVHILIGIFLMVYGVLEIISTSLVKKRAQEIITIFW